MKDKTFEKKTALFEAALNEFTAESYDDASLNAIIKNAGISKGSFYYHFTDKKELYLFLLESASKAKWDFINTKTLESPEMFECGSIFEKIRLQAGLGAEFALIYPRYHKLGRMLSGERGTPIFQAAKDYLEGDTEDMLAGMIDAAIAKGDLKSAYSREFLIKILTYLLNGFDEIFSAEEDFEPGRMLSNLDTFIEFIRNGTGN
ncbi:MAG: TetR/AcrR family transcriptional regulator [Oscillospiraceae bacterium]